LEDPFPNIVGVKPLVMGWITLKNQRQFECQIIFLEHFHKPVKKLLNLELRHALQILFRFRKARKEGLSRMTVGPVEQHCLQTTQSELKPLLESRFLPYEIQYQSLILSHFLFQQVIFQGRYLNQ